MTAEELVGQEVELETLLQRVGPVQFIRDLCRRVGGGQVLALETKALDDRRRSLLFLYRDPLGKEAFLTVVLENPHAGPSLYSLQIVAGLPPAKPSAP